mgnify:CR=1 FL=1
MFNTFFYLVGVTVVISAFLLGLSLLWYLLWIKILKLKHDFIFKEFKDDRLKYETATCIELGALTYRDITTWQSVKFLFMSAKRFNPYLTLWRAESNLVDVYPNAFMSDDEMLRKSIEQTKKLMEMENEN